MAIWNFAPPTVDEGLPQWDYDPLLRRLQLAQGVSVIEKPAGVYSARRYPTQDDIAGAVFFYQGGHIYVVSDATKAALIAGGVGVTSANFTPA